MRGDVQQANLDLVGDKEPVLHHNRMEEQTPPIRHLGTQKGLPEEEI